MGELGSLLRPRLAVRMKKGSYEKPEKGVGANL